MQKDKVYINPKNDWDKIKSRLSEYNSILNEFDDCIYDVLEKQTAKGAFEFMGYEIRGSAKLKDNQRDFRRQLAEIVGSKHQRDVFKERVKIAEQILAGTREDITQGALYFWNPDTSTISPTGHEIDEFNKMVKEGKYIITESFTNKGGLRHQMVRPAEVPFGTPEEDAPQETMLAQKDDEKTVHYDKHYAELHPPVTPRGLQQRSFLGNLFNRDKLQYGQ